MTDHDKARKVLEKIATYSGSMDGKAAEVRMIAWSTSQKMARALLAAMDAIDEFNNQSPICGMCRARRTSHKELCIVGKVDRAISELSDGC